MNKPARFLAGLLLVVGSSLVCGAAQKTADPFVKNPKASPTPAPKGPDLWENCLVTVEAYSMDRADALGLLLGGTKDAARYESVRKLVGSGKAKFEMLQSIVTKSGQKVEIGSVDGVNYFSRIESPLVRGGNPWPDTVLFRNVGDQFETTVTMPPSGIFNLEFSLKRSVIDGFHDVGASPDSLPIAVPAFRTQEISTSINGSRGTPQFLGTFSPQEDATDAPGKEWLAFVRVDAFGPTAAELKLPPGADEDGDVLLNYVCYSVDREAARAIMAKPVSPQSAWRNLQPLVVDGKARVEISASVRTPTGRHMISSGLQQFSFPSKGYGTPVLSQGDKGSSASVRNGAVEIIPGTPDELVDHDIGLVVEVEPVVSPDGMSIDLNQSPRLTTNMGPLVVPGAGKSYPPLNVFASQTVTSSLNLVAGGDPALVGTFNPPGADGVNGRVDTGRTWLLFVRGDIVGR